MPEISVLGWFHTIIGIVSLLSGFYALAKFKVISFAQLSGKVYLLSTAFVAASALGIFARDEFNLAHVLAILTLMALIAGAISENTNILGKLSPYAQAMCYSATLLFHMIPAITDGLLRLPVGDPVLTDIEDPVLKGFYLAFLICYVVGFTAQIFWLRKQN